MPTKNKPLPTPPSPLTSLSWQAPEFLVPHRGPLWYLGMVVAFLILEAASIWIVKDVFTSVLIIVSAIALLYHTSLKPRTLAYKIDSKGIYVGGIFFPPPVIKFYWFSYAPELTLHLEIKGRMMPIMILPRGIELEKLRLALAKISKEDTEKEEDGISYWIRILRL